MPWLTGAPEGDGIRLNWSKLLLSVDAGGRYLLDGDGAPSLLLGSSPQGMLVTLSTAQMDTYLSAMSGHGINMVQVHAIAGPTFGGKANGLTYDDIAPFTVTGDISTPNGTYFARLDTLLSKAASYNIVVMLNAAEYIDFGSVWTSEGNTKCYNWGAYLGNRYKNTPNIIWIVGNDFQDWSTNTNARNALLNVIDGIKSVDSNHLHTAWLDYYHSATRDSSDFNGKCELDFGYTYYVAYDKFEDEYALDPAKPVFLGETHYQNYSTAGVTGTPYIIRKQNYWSMLSGACGVTVNTDNWDFHTGWTDELDYACYSQIAYLKALFEAYDWHLLVPDTGHAVLTAGYGTHNIDEATLPDGSSTGNDWAACAALADGSLAIIYMPTNRTMTVDMSTFSGSVTCRWYDPTNGTYTADAASPHTNVGTHDFSRATTNSAGETDWCLVLEVAS